MKKALELLKQHLLCSFVIVNVLFVLVTSLLYAYTINTYKNNSLMYIPFLILNITIILIHIFIKKKKKEKIRFNKFDIFLFIFFVFTLISSILSINTHAAFFGARGRYEGFFQISYYFTVFLLSSFLDKKEKKIISYSIIVLGLMEIVHAHIQRFELLNIPMLYNHGKPWVSGYSANPNFFGSVTILSISIIIGLLFDSNTKKEKIIYSVLMAIFMSGLLISDTLSALVGLIVVLIYCFIYAIKKNKKLMFLLTLIIVFAVTTIESLTGVTVLVKDLIKTKDQTIEIAKGNIQDDFGTNRMFIWKETIKIVPNNLTYGVGVDNFRYAFGDLPLMRKHRTYDKAHNEYLQILVCEGVYALLSYLIFTGIIVINGIKYSFKNSTLYLIIPVIGYLVQAFFNISVIEVAPLFYICLGLCSSRDKKIED